METFQQLNQSPKIIRRERPLVQLGFYIFLIIFLASFFSSVVFIIMLGLAKEPSKIDLKFPIPDSPSSDVDINAELPLIGKFGSTSTAIILVGSPLFTLASLLGYCHLFNYKPY